MRAIPLLFLVLLLASQAAAQQPASSAAPKSTTTAAPSAAPAASSAAPSAPAPAADAEPELPPGHPPTGGSAGHGAMGQGPQDVVRQDASVEVGSIEVTIDDGEGKPVADVPVTLAIKYETVEEGARESTIPAKSDAEGRVRFTGQKTGRAYQYRVVANRDGASFPSRPFGLSQQSGMRVVLHTYAPITRLEEVPLVVDAVVMLELKDGNIAITHLLRMVNLGKNAFITQGIVMPLPSDASAFKEEESSDGIGVEQEGSSLLLKGTFPPGQSEATYRYQVPIDGSALRVRLSLPPRVVASRIMLGASPDMSLEVAGYPAAAVNRVGEGKRVLETGQRIDIQGGMEGLLSDVAPHMLDIRIGGIPTPGPERMIALFLVGLVVAAGAYHTYRNREQDQGLDTDQRDDLIEARTALLNEMATLERARKAGDVGPQSYERLRNALLDALARIQTRLEESSAAKARHSAALQRASAPRKATTKAAKTTGVAAAPGKAGRAGGKRKRGNKGRS